MLYRIWIVDHISGNGYSVRYINDKATSIPCHHFPTRYTLLAAMSHHNVPFIDMTLEGYDD